MELQNKVSTQQGWLITKIYIPCFGALEGKNTYRSHHGGNLHKRGHISNFDYVNLKIFPGSEGSTEVLLQGGPSGREPGLG